jgi:hypothetical protein
MLLHNSMHSHKLKEDIAMHSDKLPKKPGATGDFHRMVSLAGPVANWMNTEPLPKCTHAHMEVVMLSFLLSF